MKLPFFLLLLPVSFAALITPFSSPENMEGAVLGFIEDNDNITIAVYTFESPVVAPLLARKNATLLVEKSPAGGIPDMAVLCYLRDNGINVLLYNGSLRYMHAKYAVSGNHSLIMSENIGDFRNRGWGAIVEDNNIANRLRRVSEQDAAASIPFHCNGNYTFAAKQGNSAGLPQYDGDAELVIAPDAVGAIVDFVSSAKERLWLEQFYVYRRWGNERNALLDAFLNSKAGDKRIIIDGSWYNLDKEDKNSNYYTNEYLAMLNVPVKIKKDVVIHNKGAVADTRALVSSINWNENSPRNNREIGVIISGAAADYYALRFREDWGEKIAPPEFITVFIFSVIIVTLWLLRGKR